MPARLQFGTSEIDANLLYATKFAAPDPILLLEKGKRKTLVVRDLELGRARKEAAVNRVLGFAELEEQMRKQGGAQNQKLADYAHQLLKSSRVRAVVVPNSFPAGLLEGLRKRKIRVRVSEKPLYPERASKQPWEIGEIRRVERATEAALAKAIALLKSAHVEGRRVKKGSRIVTSEWLKQVMHEELLRRNCAAEHTIAACGEQAIEPHSEGEGHVVPNLPIVLDLFPRSQKSGYYADLTRTVVKGKASPEIKRMYSAVKEAQALAFSKLRAGVEGKRVHQAVVEYFKQKGFETSHKGSTQKGFTHATGHGVGLEIHEEPRIGRTGGPLQVNSIVTVEPGLYYKGVGGVRLEDLALVKRGGAINLTRLPKVLEV